MKTQISTSLSLITVTIAGSLLLPSCSKTQPAPTTIINVEAPAAPATTPKSDSKQDEMADLRNSNDVNADKPAVKTTIEPTDRDVEDPAPTRKSSSAPAKSKSKLLDFYDRLPSKHFVAFGGVNRRSLLNRKGAIVDYKRNFIEIPGSDDERDGDLRALQITLFPNGNEPWCAVSRIVWPQGQTPGALDFYYGEADSSDRHPRTAAASFFPYNLRKTDIGYESAWLPRRGLDIRINSAQNSEFNGPTFRYYRNFRVGEAAFEQVTDAE